MRRDYFSLHVEGTEWIETGGDPERPTVIIDFEGPASLLQNRLSSDTADFLEGTTIDVSFRYLTDREADDPSGVVSITNRMTGDYILELNAPGDRVLQFVKAAREFGRDSGENGSQYRIAVQVDSDPIVSYNKRTFLVYESDGTLLRKQSLIPSGVEL